MASQVERPWEANALDKDWRTRTVCCGVSGRVAADTNKLLQRERAMLVSPFLTSASFSLRRLHAVWCSFFLQLF